MSNVPAVQITSTGVTVPTAVTIRTGVLADTNVAFGGNLDVTTPSTPQAYLADNLTQNILDADTAIAYFVSQVDPATAEGRMQDAIARIYFLNRNGATASVVTAQCTGQPGAILPAGSLARDQNNNQWSSLGAATFSGSGLANVEFACLTLGPIQLGIGELTSIAQTVPGWDAVTNLGPATVGTATETRAAFEQRRQESVAKNGRGTVAAIRSAVWGVDGVLDVFAYDNFTNVALPYGSTSYSIAPHSIYVAVVGGANTDVANAIYQTKDAGCNLNGNTTVVITDNVNTSYPYPQYNIKFNRPTSVPIKFSVQLANNSSLPSNIEALTKAAIIATFNGTNGAQRARIGSTIFASNFYGAVAQLGTSVSIIQIKIGTATPTLDSVSMGIDQAPTIQASDITVTLV